MCKRFRDNNKLLEFCGRLNKAGVFVVIAEYVGGARRGCVMIPASSNCAGWSLFQREMRDFSTGAKPISTAAANSKNGGGGGGQFASGDWSGKILSAVGHQRKFRNFEKFRTILGQNRIPGGHAENGLVIKGKVSVINGRPTQTCTFKLTPACLALRVSKSEGGKRSVTYLDAKNFSWPKEVSGRPEILKHFGGLAQAQPVDTLSPLKGNLVNPVALKDSFEGQVTWAVGESSRESQWKCIGSPVPATIPASTREVSKSPMTVAVPTSATVRSFVGFSGAVVTDRRIGDVTHIPIVGDGKADASHNSFSLLSGLVGGFELLQDGPEHLLSQWKHRAVDPSGFFHGEVENDFLECSPLSIWDPNGHKELEVIQQGDEGEFRGSAKKGLRELKGLFSSINYDGVASKGRNRDLSVGSGVIIGFK
nr:hypothetical protein CFP56_06069 [Quercus suber]